MPRIRSVLLLAAATGVLGLPRPVLACRVEARPVAFGMLWDLPRRGAEAQGLVLLDCAAAAAGGGLRVSLGPGQGAAEAGQRRLQGPAGGLPYNLYTDPAHRQLWGDGLGATVAPIAPANGLLTVYGYIPPQLSPAPGTYSDAVEVTIDW
ncbi:SCPU domain-containing protein [Stagnimonas aquatica]|uniref:SCPU domain-containing protein n=1 Tax=Stagnimonas aquatica TaxID=2689987 RepID=A0A3N0VLN8_9GAMM|nr:spore coat U domain-containing protein [Stagnimonas aquatica]ROH93645.1 SCPU domain-containing protein [Stagnimonas aquatica]